MNKKQRFLQGQGASNITGLSAGTVITKETKEPNNRVFLGALLFACIVSFVLRNLYLSTYKRNQDNLVSTLMFAGFPNQSPLLTMVTRTHNFPR